MAQGSLEQSADSAPLTASKRGDAVDRATDDLIDAKGGTFAGAAVTINRQRDEVFAFFRDFANLPSFMDNLERIDVLDERRSHWVAKAPAGRTVAWDAEITEETPGEAIAWTSAEGADVPNSGRIAFRDAGARGTVVTATILYDPPGGAIGKLVAKLFQREPNIQARRDLRRLKQLLETGEVATSSRTRAQLEEEKE